MNTPVEELLNDLKKETIENEQKQEEQKQEEQKQIEQQRQAEQPIEQEEQKTETEKEIDDIVEMLEKNEDGMYSLTIGNEKITGKTKKEIVSKLIDVFQKRDSEYRAIKNKMKLRELYAKEEEKIEEPDRDAILEKVLKKHGIERAMLGWSREEWKRYAEEVGDFDAREVREKVRDAEREFTKKLQEATLEYVNKQLLKEGAEEAAELFAEYGIDISDEAWEEILADVYSDPKCWNEGRLKSGAIVRRAAKYIDSIRKESVKQELSKKIAVERERQKGTAIPKNAPVKREAEPKNIEEATLLLRKQLGL